MVVSTNLIKARDNVIRQAGNTIRLRYYTLVYGDVYDEAINLLSSGNDLWTSGVVLPMNAQEGSTESILMKQGKLIDSDKRLYVNGSLSFTGSELSVDIQIGSPTGDLFTTIPDGGIVYESDGVKVYKKQFIRRLTGSLV